MKERYRPKIPREALEEICNIMTPDFIYRLKKGMITASNETNKIHEEDKTKLGKVLALCNLTRTGKLEGTPEYYPRGRLQS